ncbi:MAG: hypothetical protein PHP98_10875 [Kiritimatiellae bacterium]|nr:hypothetical protein [Kiritimatiellia bacterium]
MAARISCFLIVKYVRAGWAPPLLAAAFFVHGACAENDPCAGLRRLGCGEGLWARADDDVLSLEPPQTRLVTAPKGQSGKIIIKDQTATFHLCRPGCYRTRRTNRRHNFSELFLLCPAGCYQIQHRAKYREGVPPQFIAGHEYIGMPAPTRCNWYHSGFLGLELNGINLGESPVSSITPAETRGRGILDMVWRHEAADVRVRFLGRPGNAWLFCEIALEPRLPIASIAVLLRNYPAVLNKNQPGARRILTPGALVKEGETKTLSPDQGWWALYYDDVFDAAAGRGEGPCAMMVLPEALRDIRFAPDGYAVDTRIACRPTAVTIRMAFREFKGKANAAAFAELHNEAEALRQILQTADFTPKTIINDAPLFRDKLQETRRALADPGLCKLLGDRRTAEIRKWHDAYHAWNPPGGALSIRNQETLLRALDEFNAFLWEMRLAGLVSDK